MFHTFMLFTQYILPVLIMAYSYSMMALTIWRNKDMGAAEVCTFIYNGLAEQIMIF
jgi:hypothetical protein